MACLISPIDNAIKRKKFLCETEKMLEHDQEEEDQIAGIVKQRRRRRCGGIEDEDLIVARDCLLRRSYLLLAIVFSGSIEALTIARSLSPDLSPSPSSLSPIASPTPDSSSDFSFLPCPISLPSRFLRQPSIEVLVVESERSIELIIVEAIATNTEPFIFQQVIVLLLLTDLSRDDGNDRLSKVRLLAPLVELINDIQALSAPNHHGCLVGRILANGSLRLCKPIDGDSTVMLNFSLVIGKDGGVMVYGVAHLDRSESREVGR
ncbi:hypothetical protein ACLOJK_038356 [Asimina triloba]